MSKKKFDCVEMAHECQRRVRQNYTGTTATDEVQYWNEMARLFRERQIQGKFPTQKLAKVKEFDCVVMMHEGQRKR